MFKELVLQKQHNLILGATKKKTINPRGSQVDWKHFVPVHFYMCTVNVTNINHW